MNMASRWNKAHVFDFLIQHNKQAFFYYDLASAQFIYHNSALEQMWQRNPQTMESTADCLLATIHLQDRAYVKTQYHNLLNGQVVQAVEFRILLPDGADRWISLTPYLMGAEEENSMLAGFAEDITDRKENEQTMQRFSARKNSLLEILSHDLSTPLVNIQGLSSLLKSQLQNQENEQLHTIVGLLEENARRNVHMIRTFVAQEALETANIALYKVRIDIVQTARNVIEQLKASEPVLGKTIQLLSPDSGVYLEMDEGKFVQVIANLLSNSIKFTPVGGSIITRIEEKDRLVLITIKDTGIGIPRTLQPLVFDKFTKAKRPGLRGQEAIGMGLSITKSIVELHKGKIWFESEENKGTTFFIEIPNL